MELSYFNKSLPIFPIISARVKSNSWVRSAVWDGFWLHSGLWLIFLMLIVNSSRVQEMFYATGVFLFWISHRFSSFYLAWGTRAYHQLRINQQRRFVFFPLLLGVVVFGVLLIPESIFPVPFTVRILGLFLLDFAWGIHHFAAQHYGILRLYHHRWNPDSASLSNRWDRWYCWGVGGFLVLIAELLHGTSFLQEKHFLPLFTWDVLIGVIPLILRLGSLLVVVITIFMIRNALNQDSGLPKILYILGVSAMVVAAFLLEPFQFLMLWTLQHWMVALGLATHMGGNDVHQESITVNNLTKKSPSKMSWKPWYILFLFCVFSVAMTPFFEFEAVSAGGRYSEQLFPSLMEWLQKSSWGKMLLGIGLASGFLHYFMDRSVYRFSDTETRNSAEQLLFA